MSTIQYIVLGNRWHSQFRLQKDPTSNPMPISGPFAAYQTTATTIRNVNVCQVFRPDGAIAATGLASGAFAGRRGYDLPLIDLMASCSAAVASSSVGSDAPISIAV
jgi:hypothetical protein